MIDMRLLTCVVAFQHSLFLFAAPSWNETGSYVYRPCNRTGSLNRRTTQAPSKTCFFNGKTYQLGERIPQQHPCHHCFCHYGHINCYWQNCPPPPYGCSELNYHGVCNPSLYRCPISPYDNALNRKKRDSDIPPEPIESNKTGGDCQVFGVWYRTGEIIGDASHNCLHCYCASGELYCRPLCCLQYSIDQWEDSRQGRQRQDRKPIEPHPLAHRWRDNHDD